MTQRKYIITLLCFEFGHFPNMFREYSKVVFSIRLMYILLLSADIRRTSSSTSLLFVEDLSDCPDNVASLRCAVQLQGLSVGHWHVGSCHPHDGGVKIMEDRALHHLGTYLCPHSMLRPTGCKTNEFSVEKFSSL